MKDNSSDTGASPDNQAKPLATSLTNALKYAFPDSRQGEIRIELRGKNDGAFTFVVADDGIGIPEHIDFRNTESLGLQVVCTLVEQLGGMIDMERGPGTRFSMTFSAPA